METDMKILNQLIVEYNILDQNDSDLRSMNRSSEISQAPMNPLAPPTQPPEDNGQDLPAAPIGRDFTSRLKRLSQRRDGVEQSAPALDGLDRGEGDVDGIGVTGLDGAEGEIIAQGTGLTLGVDPESLESGSPEPSVCPNCGQECGCPPKDTGNKAVLSIGGDANVDPSKTIGDTAPVSDEEIEFIF
jgi:hypothetical protein